MARVLIHGAEILGHSSADLRIAKGRIAAIGQLTPHPGERIIDARGGALLPGLHDHHIHLAGLAARQSSLVCGPPKIADEGALAASLRAAPGEGWLRGILYHESVMGLPDAAALDRLITHRPMRIQHRSGRMWLFNSAGLARALANAAAPPGLERANGAYTGRLFDEDAWLAGALAGQMPDFAAASAELARHGITGLTDMSVRNDAPAAAHFAAQIAAGKLTQRVMLAGTLALAETAQNGWRIGPAKLHLHEAALPDLDATIAFIAAAHRQDRAIASHCTTEVELVFTLAALAAAGPMRGDRIEHAGIASDALVAQIAQSGLSVVSQPHFIAERGEEYAAAIPAGTHAHLYRLAAFRGAGITLAAGSDAPFGSADPWAGMAAAITRRTHAGRVIGGAEALSPEAALALYLADPADLARQRRIAVGAEADLCLLAKPWAKARTRLSSGDVGSADVAATIVAGALVHDAIDQPPA